jgi:xenotropic and polytropic retrovirus receptor 1
MAELPSLQVQFFEALDRELFKVENFYREREKDAIAQSAIIKKQLDELKDHRRTFHVCTLHKAAGAFTD